MRQCDGVLQAVGADAVLERIEPMAQKAPYSAAGLPASVTPSGPRAPLAQARIESCCRVGGSLRRIARTIPLVPDLLTAFAAYSHGTEFATPTGPGLAIEDIEPGMSLRMMDGRETKVLWTGALDLLPGMAGRVLDAGTAPMVRILPDRFGYARPARDLILGARAQVKWGDGKTRYAADIIDYEQVLPVTPPGPVRLYQLVCERPGAELIANGLGVPSFGLGQWLEGRDPMVQGLVALFLPGGDRPNNGARVA